MATLDEILSFSENEESYLVENPQFLIDEDLRTIAFDSRGSVIGVVGDKNVNRINFQMNRMYNGFDMSEFQIRVNYVNAAGQPNYYNVTDMEIDGDIIRFSWLVDSDATAYIGDVTFVCVLFKLQGAVITQAFNTTLARAKVLEGLAVDGYVDPDTQTDIVMRLVEDILSHVPEFGTIVDKVNDFIENVVAEKSEATDTTRLAWEDNGGSIELPDMDDFNSCTKIRIDYLGNKVFKYGDTTLNFEDLYNYHMNGNHFAFIVYGNRAYLCSMVNVDSSQHEMRFESVINSDNRTKVSSIYITSNDGTTISTVSVSDINSENSSNKVSVIDDTNKDSTDKYPSVKAVTGIRDELTESINEILTVVSDADFKQGSIAFTNAQRKQPKYVESTTQQYCFLTNCKYFRATVKSGTLGVLTLNRETGVWGAAETVQTGNFIVKKGLTDYIIVHTGTLNGSLDIVALFDDYQQTITPMSNTAPVVLSGMLDSHLFTSVALTRLQSGIIKGVKDFTFSIVNSAYQAMLYYTDENGMWNTTSYGYSFEYHTEYARNYIILIKRTDNANVTEKEVTNQYKVSYGTKIGSAEVVHYNVTAYNRTGTGYTDESILVLPSNYSKDGEPVRLVVVCHGAGATRYANAVMDSTGKIVGDPQRVLTKMGYAVLDTFAAPYGAVGTSYSGLHFGSPIVLSCYKKSIDYALSNYNLKQDGIAVCGSSMGGLSALQLITLGGYNVIASALYCPCVDLFKEAWCNPWDRNAKYSIATLYNFSPAPSAGMTSAFPPTEAEKEYFKSNIMRTMGLYPMMFDANFNFADIYNAFPESATGLDETAEAEVYNQYRKFLSVPIKFFHCKNDTTMAYRYTEYFFNMLKRGGSLVDFISYDTGGHNAWASGNDVTLTDVNGNQFTCKDSQAQGYYWLKSFGA